MKILWLSHFAPYPPKGGAMQRSYNMIKQLSGDEEVTLVSLVSFSKVSSFYGDYEEGYREIKNELEKICKHVELVPYGRYKRKLTKIFNGFKTLFTRDCFDVVSLKSSELQIRLDDVLQQRDFDVMHVDTIGLWPYIKETCIPVILNHHNIESHMLERRAQMAKWPFKTYLKIQANKLYKLERKASQIAEMNITCSTLDGDRLKEHGKIKVVTIPNGVDLDYFTRRKDYDLSKGKELIFAGGLDWYPNRDAMVFFSEKIWPLLNQKKSDKPFKMTVVGKGVIPSLNELSNKDSNLKVAGFVDDVRDYLEDAGIYVCPIKDGGGTKLKVLDALAMGVPLVAHPISCEGIDVTNGKDVIFAESPQEFAEAIMSLSDDELLRKDLSQNGRLLIEELYSYKKIGVKMIEQYQDVVVQHLGKHQ